MIDMNLLRIVKYRDDYFKLRGRIPDTALSKQTAALMHDFGKYFDRLPDAAVVDVPTFTTMFRAWHPKLSAEHLADYERIIRTLSKDVPEAEKDSVLRAMLELRLGGDLLKLVTEFEEGEVPNIHSAVDDVMESFKRDANIRTTDFLRTDIGDLLQQEIDDSGLRWRLDCLNKSMRGLRDGDFGIIAGRPDRGKTTMLASETTFMAPQPQMDGRPVLWLNNEGIGDRIRPRLYQAALGKTMQELIAMHRDGTLNTEYEAYMNMEWRMRVFDIHGFDTYAVENIIEKHNPGLVVFDMIDNIRGFKDAARTDLVLEQMYQWGRDLAVKYRFAGIATSQISFDGDGLQFPNQSMLKDSKTGKQGACDFQIMIGASNDAGLQRVRYIGTPKNKLHRVGGPVDPRATVQYKPEIARYEDLPTTTEDEDEDE